MTYLASTLITNSWYLSGIVARNLQTPTGDQMTNGLYLLNALLDYKQIETDLIPYWTYIGFPLVQGQEFYFLPYVAAVESATFNIDVLRYPTVYTPRTNYFGSSRVDNINTLPFSWNFNRGHNGGTFAMYFKPDSNYALKMMVKLFLTEVTLTTDLTNINSLLNSGFVSNVSVTSTGSGYTTVPTVTITGGGGTGATAVATVTNGQVSGVTLTNFGSGYTSQPTATVTGGGGTGAQISVHNASYTFFQTNNSGFDTSYIEYLRYSLAGMMCSEYGILFNPESQKILDKYERKLMYESPPDLSMKKLTILGSDRVSGFNWGDVNQGRGWRP